MLDDELDSKIRIFNIKNRLYKVYEKIKATPESNFDFFTIASSLTGIDEDCLRKELTVRYNNEHDSIDKIKADAKRPLKDCVCKRYSDCDLCTANEYGVTECEYAARLDLIDRTIAVMERD